MPKELYEYLEDEEPMRKRFIEGAFQEAEDDATFEAQSSGTPKKNKINSVSDLQYYLEKYLDTENGHRASNKLNDSFDKALKVLFESSEFKNKIQGQDGGNAYELIETSRKEGHHIKKDFQVIVIKKEVAVRNYVNKEGEITVGYTKTKPRKFNDRELNYLIPRLDDNPKSIVADFNKRFHDFPRTDSSILTKVGRIKRSNKRSFKK